MICNKYVIYRLKNIRSYGFKDMSFEKFKRMKMIVERDYYKLYENTDEIVIVDRHIYDFLERIFCLSEGSIHMGDIIEVLIDNKRELYFCNNIGWIRIN